MDVGELVAPDLVNTMPEATAVADHGVIRNYTIRVNYTDAQRVLDDLAAVGIDCQAVVTLLEEEGAGKFKPSWALVADQLPDRPWAAQATPPSHTSFHTLTVDQEATTP